MFDEDILEDDILRRDAELLNLLLKDHTTSKKVKVDGKEVEEIHNILWATSDYRHDAKSEIKPEHITGVNGKIIQPRVVKSKSVQSGRTREMAEVFTPAWICNAQNNLIDEAWFGRKNVFNTEFVDENGKHSWKTNQEKITFPEGKTWKDYVKDTRLEITCGEAPYLVSRYDAATGEKIPLKDRIGIIDRKLRVISENVDKSGEWLKEAQKAFKSTYGYEFQGDNLLLARENMLIAFVESYYEKFKKEPCITSLRYIAYIIGWNLWQMDGLKGVVPFSCYDKVSKNQPVSQIELFEEPTNVKKTTNVAPKIIKCTGCEEDNINKHNGIYCLIRDWSIKDKKKRRIKFIDTMKQQ